jgi:hypothetical protein
MIVIKIAFIVVLCYYISKGLASEAEKKVIETNKKLKVVQDAAKEAYSLMQAEKEILTNTIKELRDEVKLLKGLKK